MSEDYKTELLNGEAVDEIWYNTSGYCIYNGAELAAELGVRNISILEFGVASGDGLQMIEHHATNICEEIEVDFEIYGFDSMEGLPKPEDYRDMPYLWKEGQYEGDISDVEEKVENVEMVLGDVADTVPDFTSTYDPAPIGCIIVDLDLYSSTSTALNLFDEEHEVFLPRVPMYFDDVSGHSLMGNFNDYTGELRAIHDFNDSHDEMKIVSPKFMTNKQKEYQLLLDRIYTHHRFGHPMYNNSIS